MISKQQAMIEMDGTAGPALTRRWIRINHT
jgi:hypothetical protein